MHPLAGASYSCYKEFQKPSLTRSLIINRKLGEIVLLFKFTITLTVFLLMINVTYTFILVKSKTKIKRRDLLLVMKTLRTMYGEPRSKPKLLIDRKPFLR